MQAKPIKLTRVVAVHEAGHAVGRFLTAADLGYTTDEAIAFIEIGPGGPVGQSLDGETLLLSQAVTFGPMLSKEIQEAVSASIPRAEITYAEIAKVMVRCRSTGLDIEKWLRAKALIIVFGSAAEAKYLSKSFADVWNSHANEADAKDAIRDCFLAGVTDEQAIEAVLNDAAIRSKQLLDQAAVWRAVLALADELPVAGKFEGKKAAAIISRTIAERPELSRRG